VEATDYPSDAATFSLNVMTGDIVVMGSDGLFDNCPLPELLALLPDRDEEVGAAAERIAALARRHAGAPAPALQDAAHGSSCAPALRESFSYLALASSPRPQPTTPAEDPEFESPYILQALQQGMDLPWWEKLANTRVKDGKLQIGRLSGGKQDDITVLVARVSDRAATSQIA